MARHVGCASIIKTRTGFTLVEMVAVMFIIALGVSIVGVSITTSLARSEVKNEAALVRNTLAKARDLALMKRVPVEFVADTTEASYWLVRGQSPYGRRVTLPEGYKLLVSDQVEDNEGIIRFMPKGDSSGGAVFIKSREGRTYAVVVDPVTGSAKLSRI